MRIFIFSLAMAIVVSGQMAHSASAASVGNQRAQQIAKDLKQSGMLKDYRVGVKFEDGVAWLTGTVTSPQQKKLAVQIARRSAGVKHVVSKLEVENNSDLNVEPASNMQLQRRPQPNRARTARRPGRSNMPVPYARTAGQGIQPAAYSRQAQFQAGPNGMGPAPMGNRPPAAVGQSVSYDNPQMPGYAWPSYAASPNYAALTYPKQYSASAWPYIGPFYPYPQVPLGWRKVTLEWDDGWWNLDFKDCKRSR